MRILFLDQFSDLGGAQRNLLALLQAVLARGWEGLVGLPGDGELFGRVGQLGFETFRFPCGPFGLGRKPATDWLRFMAQLPAEIQAIRSQTARFRPHVLFLNGPRVLPAAALAGMKVPALFHTQSYLPPGASRALSSWALNRLRAQLIGCCRFVTEPWRPRPASVIYNGVTGPERPMDRPVSGAPKIGCIGRISAEKGQLEFVSAARLIHRSLPGARFVIYGAPLFSRDAGIYAERVRAAAQGLPVEFGGWASDVYQAMAGLDLLLVPSAGTDATPLVVLEGLSAGLPVVAFRSGGIPELIADGDNGFLADSVQQMADCAISLLTGDGSRRRRVETAARESWLTRFTLRRWQEQMMSEIERVAGREPGLAPCNTNPPASSAYSIGL